MGRSKTISSVGYHPPQERNSYMNDYTVKTGTMDIIRIKGDSPSECFENMSVLDKACFGTDGWSAHSFFAEACQPDGIVLAAYCDNVFAGLFVGFTASDTGEILSLAVSPEFRRKGIAQALLSEFLKLIPDEIETVALEVRQSNTAAIALYKSFGFERAGVRKRFYRDPVEDADIMVLNRRGAQ